MLAGLDGVRVNNFNFYRIYKLRFIPSNYNPHQIGSLPGMNDQQMAISEIGASYADETFGHESRRGIPFTYILRDVLQFDKSLEDSKKRMKEASRTCNLILGKYQA